MGDIKKETNRIEITTDRRTSIKQRRKQEKSTEANTRKPDTNPEHGKGISSPETQGTERKKRPKEGTQGTKTRNKKEEKRE